MFYIGIDIAKKKHEVCFTDESGNILDGNSFKIPNTRSGLDKFQEMLEKYELSAENAMVGLEATGHYWLVLYSCLVYWGFSVKVINPIVTDGYRRTQIRKTKTDRIDAVLIAKVLRLGDYQETVVADEDLLSLRQLSRFRLSQVQACSDLKRKCVAILDQVFPEYQALFTDIFGMTSTALLSNYSTPEEMAAVHTTKLSNLLKKASKGRFEKAKALEIKAVAKTSIGITFASDAFVFEMQQILRQIRFIEQQIEELDQKIDNYMKELNSPITTIPGIGPVYGAVILSELGNIHRFPSGKELVSYAGIDASVSQSGEFTGSDMHMSKRGSPYLRRAIYGAAFIASWADPELEVYYKSLIKRGKHHKVAVGAVARKLSYIIYAILTENRPFEVRT